MRWPRTNAACGADAGGHAGGLRCAAVATMESLECRRLLSADLAVALAAVPSALPPDGGTGVTVQVINVSNEMASGRMNVTLFASLDGNLDGGDVAIGGATRGLKIKPGRGAAVTVKVSAPAGLADGDYHLIARLDATSAGDANAVNNLAVSSTTVAIRAPFVDIAARVVDVPRSSFFSGGPAWSRSGRARVQAFNQGNVAATGPVSVSFYLSADAALDGADVLLAALPTKSVSIPAGHGKTFCAKLLVPAGTAPANYTVIAVVNAGPPILDVDPTNNVAIAPGTLSVVSGRPPYHGGHHDHGGGHLIGYGAGGAIFDNSDYDTGGYYDTGGGYDTSGGGYDEPPSSQPSDSGSGDDSSSDDYSSSGSDFGDSSSDFDSSGSDF